jgi:hypothetical protein
MVNLHEKQKKEVERIRLNKELRKYKKLNLWRLLCLALRKDSLKM